MLNVIHILESSRATAGAPVVSLVEMIPAADQAGIRLTFHCPDGNEAGTAIPPDRLSVTTPIKDGALLHIHGWGYVSAAAMAKSARAAKMPYVISPAGAISRSGAQGLAARIRWLLRDRGLVRGATFLAAANEAEQRELQAVSVHSDVRILPYGLNFAVYAHQQGADVPPSSGPTGDLPLRRLLMMGSLDPHSGCVGLLKALAELGPLAEGWQVVLAGTCHPHWRKALEAAIRRKGATERVMWTDGADLAAQLSALRQADVFVAPATTPGPSVATLQALAAAVPALCTDCVAPPLADQGLHVCRPGKAEIREALRKLLQMSDLQRRADAAAVRTRAAAVLDWSALMPRYAAEYASIGRG